MNARLQSLLAYAPSGAGERNMSYRSACEGTRTRRGATCLARLHIMWVPFWLLLLGNVALGDTFLVKSEDRGRSWMDVDLGPPHHLLVSFKAVLGTSTIYALTQTLDDGYRIVVSKDSGTTWHVLERLSVRGAEVLGFTVQAGNPDVVYVAKTAFSPHDGPHSPMILIKTTDAGNTVTEFPASGFKLPGGVVEGRYFRPVLLAFVASPSGILYANAYCGGDDDGNFCPEAWSGNSIVRSVDGGYNWTSFSEYGSVFDVLFDHSAASTVYLVTNRELLRSSDGGETWASIKPAGCRQAPVLAVHTRNPAVLMNVCLYHEAVLPGMTRNSPCLYRSTDYGETWERVHVFESGPLQNLTFDAEDDSLIYGLTTSNEPMRSEDGGRTFTRMFANLPRLAFILAGPSSQNTIWAGTIMRFPVAFGQRHTFVRDVLGRSEIGPGKIMSIYGEELASDTRDAEVLPWSDSLLGAAVRFSGRPASVSSVSPNQINVQVPFGFDEGPVIMEVTRSDGSSHRQTVFALYKRR